MTQPTIGDQLLAASQLRRATIDVDGIEVTIREPSTEELEQYSHLHRAAKQDDAEISASLAYLLKVCVINDAGESVLTEEQAEVLAGMRTQSSRVGPQIFDRIADLAGLQSLQAGQEGGAGKS